MAKKPPSQSFAVGTSTSYSEARYAHPFFLPAAPRDRQVREGGESRITDWSKKQLGPIPALKAGSAGVIDLAEIIGSKGVGEIEQLGEIRLHTVGDTGVGHADEAELVAEDMSTDFKAGAGALNPALLLHLGDVVYGPDKGVHYAERFYRPYRHYPGKIIAIPGNHDGEAKSPADEPSLNAFQANFCTPKAAVPKQAAESGIFRKTMTQPAVYWLLEAPFLRVIGLYSNRLENPGFLEGDGGTDLKQIDWLTKTLKTIAKQPGKALIIATHHPPFSQSTTAAARKCCRPSMPHAPPRVYSLTPLSLDTLTIINVTHAGWAVSRLRIL